MAKRKDRIVALTRDQEAERGRERDEIGQLQPSVPTDLEIPVKPCREGAEPQADIEEELFGGFDRRDADGTSFQRLPVSSRGWAAEKPTNRAWPFVIQAWRQAEQKRPVVTPERDRVEELDKIARRLELLEKPTDPNSGPSSGLVRGLLREEKAAFLAQHIERAIQKAWCRRYRPSKALEGRRFPQLERVETGLLPKEELGKAERRAWARAEADRLVAEYYGGIERCPSEWTTRELNLIIEMYATRKKRGRKPIGAVAMTATERKRRQRGLKIISDAPSITGEQTNVDHHDVRARPARVGAPADAKADRE